MRDFASENAISEGMWVSWGGIQLSLFLANAICMLLRNTSTV